MLLIIPRSKQLLFVFRTDNHAKYVIDAARAGEHIFCGKNLFDLSLEVIGGAIEAVKKAGVKFIVALTDVSILIFRKSNSSVTEGKDTRSPYPLK